jgi:uncharacterized membrane protein
MRDRHPGRSDQFYGAKMMMLVFGLFVAVVVVVVVWG